MYKAIKEIGGYKVGETVPDEKARIWLAQYDVPHVEEEAGEGKPNNKDDKPSVKEEKKEVASKKDAASDSLLDDYLNRNVYVVVKNIRIDTFSKSQIEKMVAIEIADKNRPAVLAALRVK